MEKAIVYLREKGIAAASKKSGRATKEGRIMSLGDGFYLTTDGEDPELQLFFDATIPGLEAVETQVQGGGGTVAQLHQEVILVPDNTVQKQLRNRVPWRARRSRFGVTIFSTP